MILEVCWVGLWTLSLGSHDFTVTALGACVKWPSGFSVVMEARATVSLGWSGSWGGSNLRWGGKGPWIPDMGRWKRLLTGDGYGVFLSLAPSPPLLSSIHTSSDNNIIKTASIPTPPSSILTLQAHTIALSQFYNCRALAGNPLSYSIQIGRFARRYFP